MPTLPPKSTCSALSSPSDPSDSCGGACSPGRVPVVVDGVRFGYRSVSSFPQSTNCGTISLPRPRPLSSEWEEEDKQMPPKPETIQTLHPRKAQIKATEFCGRQRGSRNSSGVVLSGNFIVHFVRRSSFLCCVGASHFRYLRFSLTGSHRAVIKAQLYRNVRIKLFRASSSSE